MTKEMMLFQHPSLPDSWDYQESVKKMKGLIYKWKNLTRDVANELWVARENLSAQGQRSDLTSEENFRSWTDYCEDIGSSRQVINGWLKGWFPEQLDLEQKPLLQKAHFSDWLPEQKEADLLLTDPPYSTDVDDVYAFARDWLPRAFEKIKATGRAYICIGAYPNEIEAYIGASQTLPLRLTNILVWTYQNTLGPQPTHDYKLNWQAILYYRGPDCPPLNCPLMVEQFTVQQISAPDARQADRYHEWQKPLELADRLIKHSTKEDDLVIDPFVGTGTFILAANRLGRKGFGCDTDDIALDIAIKRGCKFEQEG